MSSPIPPTLFLLLFLRQCPTLAVSEASWRESRRRVTWWNRGVESGGEGGWASVEGGRWLAGGGGTRLRENERAVGKGSSERAGLEGP